MLAIFNLILVIDHDDGQFFRAMEWLMFFFRPPLPSMVFRWFLIFLPSLSMVFDGSGPLVKQFDGFDWSSWSNLFPFFQRLILILQIQMLVPPSPHLSMVGTASKTLMFFFFSFLNGSGNWIDPPPFPQKIPFLYRRASLTRIERWIMIFSPKARLALIKMTKGGFNNLSPSHKDQGIKQIQHSYLQCQIQIECFEQIRED